MRYKVFCSNGYEGDSFYIEDKSKANLLFNMAVDSKMFEYVSLEEVIDEGFLQREWSADGDNA